MANKLISADALQKAIRDDSYIDGVCFARVKKHIEEAEDAVKHGRWVASGCGFDCCSECHKVYADGYLTAMGIKPRTQFNYCPNCGAKMDGDGNV